MKTRNHVENIGIRYGLMTCAGLIVYFFIMRILNLAQYQELRLLNALILTGGVIMAISKLKRTEGKAMQYLSGISCGMLTSLVGVGCFAVFVCIYLLIDRDFMSVIQAKNAASQYIDVNPFSGAFIIFLEGIFSGAIITLCVMQYMKSSIMEEMEAELEQLPKKTTRTRTQKTSSFPAYQK